MSEASNVSSVPERHVCVCGEPLVAITFHGDRGITNLKRGRTECPLTLTCLMGHDRELWMTFEEARPYFDSVIVVGR